MKRFYTAAAVSGEAPPFGIALDARPVRTPARAALQLPTLALACGVAAEWEAQRDIIRPHTMPLTGLSNAAIDRVAPDPAGFADTLAAYAQSELLAYRAEAPGSLVGRQLLEWDPWLDWARHRYDIEFVRVTGIVHRAQPPATLARIAEAYRSFDAFRLAALHPVVTITGSAVLALAVAEGALDAGRAWTVSHLDEVWQAEQWGKDPLAEGGHAARQAELAAATEMLRLLA